MNINKNKGLVDDDNSDNDSDKDDPEMAGLCEYEKLWLIVCERQAMYEKLNISGAKSEFSQMFTHKKARNKNKLVDTLSIQRAKVKWTEINVLCVLSALFYKLS